MRHGLYCSARPKQRNAYRQWSCGCISRRHVWIIQHYQRKPRNGATNRSTRDKSREQKHLAPTGPTARSSKYQFFLPPSLAGRAGHLERFSIRQRGLKGNRNRLGCERISLTDRKSDTIITSVDFDSLRNGPNTGSLH